MNLNDHLAALGRTKTDFARSIDMSLSVVSKIANGKRFASLDQLLDIFGESRGEVTPNDLFFAHPEFRARFGRFGTHVGNRAPLPDKSRTRRGQRATTTRGKPK